MDALSWFITAMEKVGSGWAILVALSVLLWKWGHAIGMFLKDKLFDEQVGNDGKARGLFTKVINSHVSLISKLESSIDIILNQQEETHQAVMEYATATRVSVEAINRSVEAIQKSIESQHRLEQQRVPATPPLSGIGIGVMDSGHKTKHTNDPESVI